MEKGREGERERKRERERERDTRVYEIYLRGEKFRNDRITVTFSSFLFFSPVVRESEALHLLGESKIVGPRVFSPPFIPIHHRRGRGHRIVGIIVK